MPGIGSLIDSSVLFRSRVFVFFFFNDTATTEIYTLSLHDALPICWCSNASKKNCAAFLGSTYIRSEEHTSELQSRLHLVCRLLLEKKKQKNTLRHKCIPPNEYDHTPRHTATS